MIKRSIYRSNLAGLTWLVILLTLAACGAATPTPDPDGPRLVGFNVLPKSLATIQFSPTPNQPQVQATASSRPSTDTPEPSTFTPTPTPAVGIFMGAPTFATGVFFPPATKIKASPVAVLSTPVIGTLNTPGAPVLVTPFVINVTPGSTTNQNCSVAPAPEFARAAANSLVAQKLGCPKSPAVKLTMVMEPFQNGFMFWRDTKDIYILSTAAFRTGGTSDTFWRVTDTWNSSLLDSDPSLTPPAGLLQPVRGFGYAWRNNANFRNALGWALTAEQQYQAVWQDFDHGWMMSANNGIVFALAPSDGPPPTVGVQFGPMHQ